MFGKLVKRGAIVVAGAAVALSVQAVSTANAAPSAGVCTGTDTAILGGTYSSLTIKGSCLLDQGTVNVTGNVTIKAGAFLYADYGGSDLRVIGNITVASGGILVLGCDPDATHQCFNDPTLTTNDSVAGSVTASNAEAVIIEHANVKGAVKVNNGGGGDNCDPDATIDENNDVIFSNFEDDNFGSTVSITKVTTCFVDYVDNQAKGTVTFSNNTSDSVDGNEISGNNIGGDLKCVGNDLPPFGETTNNVAGTRTGQCQATDLP